MSTRPGPESRPLRATTVLSVAAASPTAVRDTVATALGAIAIVIDAVMPVFARVIVIGVATGAIRLVYRGRPVHSLRITLMAARAGEIAGVIQRLVTQTHVLVDMRSPSIGRMAVNALKVRRKVPLVLASRRVSIMA